MAYSTCYEIVGFFYSVLDTKKPPPGLFCLYSDLLFVRMDPCLCT